MKNILFALLCAGILVGCIPRHIDNDVSVVLQPATLRNSFNTQIPNLKERSKCGQADISVNIINIEKTNIDITLARGRYINSQKTTDMLVEYLKDGYRQCRILSNPNSPKVIAISFLKLDGYSSFSSGATLQINVSLPEKNTVIPFMISQSTLELHNAVAYTIHDITWQIINDPIIQDYITCR
jgi:hypothetical protein